MLRRSRTLLLLEYPWPVTNHPRRIGYYPEDHSNDWDLQLYTHPQKYREYYTRQERTHAEFWSDLQRSTESANFNSGLHFSGEGPFERELKRKGIQVEKYKLPSTVAMKRVHEMVLLRRRAIEKKSAEKMEKVRESLNAAKKPSSWLDETDGPVNPHFLKMAFNGKTYEEFQLPRTPIVKGSEKFTEFTQ
jgi:hypothetical protein